MNCVELCYARPEDRTLCEDRLRVEVEELGFKPAPDRHLWYYVPASREEEIKAVVLDFNEAYGGSLWLWWWDGPEPTGAGIRWVPWEV